MHIEQKKRDAIFIRVIPDLKKRITDKAKELNCNQSSLITSMLEHCLKKLDEKKED